MSEHLLHDGCWHYRGEEAGEVPTLIWIMEVNLETDEAKLDQPFLTTR